jgi:hypothetical protein
MKEILRQLFTNAGGQHDIGRYSWLVCTVFLSSAAVLNWWHKQEIDLTAYGTSLAAIALAHGAALGLKAKTEDTPK